MFGNQSVTSRCYVTTNFAISFSCLLFWWLKFRTNIHSQPAYTLSALIPASAMHCMRLVLLNLQCEQDLPRRVGILLPLYEMDQWCTQSKMAVNCIFSLTMK